MALNSLYTDIHRGAMTLIGNTASVNRDTTDWFPYVYMSTIPSNQVAGYLGNTVSDVTTSYSSCQLNIPSTCTVKFARLVWYGESAVPNVKLVLPNGTVNTIAATTTQNASIFYSQLADVTNIINTNKSGEYTVGNFVGCAGYPGWSMIVIYEDENLPFRYFNAYLGIQPVDTTTPAPLTFTNFITPSSGPVKGYIALSYGRGDILDGAQFKVGPTIANTTIGNTSTTVWNGMKPYNKSTNMFPGLICFGDCNDPSTVGLLNTQSTLSTRNINPYEGTYTASGRDLFDVTAIDISDTFVNGQTTLYTSIFFGGTGSADSLIQAVQIDMNSANINPTKVVDKALSSPNDILTYSLILNNTGLLDANNLVVVDTLPNGVSFINGSLQVNGVTVAGSPEPPGYTVGTVPFSSTTTLTFKVLVNTSPIVTTALNNSYNMSYSFTAITTPEFLSGISNTVTTTIPVASLINISKSVNKRYADIGNYLNYTITIPNTGQFDAGNVMIFDTIPLGTTFVADSLKLNGVTINGANPQSGVNIGTIAIGETSVVKFTVLVVTIPSINPILNNAKSSYLSYGITQIEDISNTVTTKINNATIALSKLVNLSFADVGNTLTYTLVFNNTGNVAATSVNFSDTIPNDTSFISNSLTIDGVTVVGNPAPPTGVKLGTIAAGVVSTLTFAVVINTIPSPNPIKNTGTVGYRYTVDSEFINAASSGEDSNTVQTQVNHAEIILTKITSESYAVCGTTITYTVALTNVGNASALNLAFKDTIPNGTQYIENSFTLNGITLPGENPNNGINLGTIAGGATSTITFNVKITC